MTSFAIEPIYGSLIVAMIAIAATVAVVMLVTPPTTDASQRRWLIGLRLAAAAILILTLLRPTLVRTDNRPADAALVVAVDTSRSMTLPDGDGGDRWTTQIRAWRELASGLSDRDAALDVRLLSYDKQATESKSTSPDALADVIPGGNQTDLKAAMAATISAAEGQPIAGVVVMGDGAQTAPVIGGGAVRIAETFDSLGVPLWTVPIGPPRGDSESRDVAIDALSESFQMFAGNRVDVTFQVASRGMSGTNVDVALTWIDSEGSRTEAATRTVAVDSAINTAAITVPLIAPSPGTYQLEVQAGNQPGELVTTNNRQIAFVDVREGGGRILYLFGNLDQEQTLIRRSLRRFPDLDLMYRWIPNDTANSWPVDLPDWFTPGAFDTYIIGDLDADALGEKQLSQLAAAVDAGAGLVTLGGFQAYGNGGYATSPIAKVIPIVMDPSRRRSIDDTQPSENQIDAPVVIDLARNHPITDLGGRDPAQTWQELPPLLGANRWSGPKVAPGVEVLLRTVPSGGSGEPLMVIGQYGKGRTAAIAFDSSWRWWRAGQSDAHRRFWRQLMLWLLAREDNADDQILIQLDSRRFSSEQPADFRATATSLAQGSTLVAEVLIGGDGDSDSNPPETRPVDVIEQAQGESSAADRVEAKISGTLAGLPAGIHRLRVRSSDPASTVAAAEVAFQVIDESRELAQPMADPLYLRQLAELTADHGGAAFDADQIDGLIARILQRRKRSETPVIEKLRLGDGPATGWPLFLLFAGALSTEWFLRRRWGLA